MVSRIEGRRALNGCAPVAFPGLAGPDAHAGVAGMPSLVVVARAGRHGYRWVTHPLAPSGWPEVPLIAL